MTLHDCDEHTLWACWLRTIFFVTMQWSQCAFVFNSLCPHDWTTTEIKMKRNWNCFSQRTAVKRFSCFNQSLLIDIRCLSSKAEAGNDDVCVTSSSQRWIVTRYCNSLIFGVTRYILPKVTLQVTSYFLPKLVTHMIYMFIIIIAYKNDKL